MRDWQTYRNGNPRAIWDLERLSRHRAAKLGYRVHRSRRQLGWARVRVGAESRTSAEKLRANLRAAGASREVQRN
jgi:hypothetical protein